MAILKFEFLSTCLGHNTTVTAILPTKTAEDIIKHPDDPGIEYCSGLKYQTLYLLHGSSGSQNDYLYNSNIVRYANRNKIAVIMPTDYNMRYTDNPGHAQYFKFIVEELPRVCQTLFPLSSRREDTFIGGLSMGAGGAAKAALLYPQQYAAALLLSGGFTAPAPPKSGQREGFFQQAGMPGPFSDYEKGNVFTEEVLRARVDKLAEEQVEFPKFYMIWGTEEPPRVMRMCDELSRLLRSKGADVYTEIVPGYTHEWDLWDLALEKALRELLPIRRNVIYPTVPERN